MDAYSLALFNLTNMLLLETILLQFSFLRIWMCPVYSFCFIEMLGTEMDLQHVEATVLAVENALKMWLHEQGGDREHLHLLLPPSLTPQGSSPNTANNKPSPGMQTRTYTKSLWASPKMNS